VPLKSYRCKTGADQNAPQIRIEFHRLSDLAASLMISNTSSTMLTKTFGAIKVVGDDVSKPMAICSSNSEPPTKLSRNKEKFRPTIDQRRSSKGGRPSFRRGYDRSVKVRHFMETTDGPDYPAADEIAALRKKAIPDGLNYYYAIDSWFCQDHSDFVCKKAGKTSFEMLFWKSMRADDVINYPERSRLYSHSCR